MVGHDVDVRGDVGRPVDHRGEPTDQDVWTPWRASTSSSRSGRNSGSGIGQRLPACSCEAERGLVPRTRASGSTAGWCSRPTSRRHRRPEMRTSSNPQAARRGRPVVGGLGAPGSSRAIADWVVPIRSASSAWVRPARRRASRIRAPASIHEV